MGVKANRLTLPVLLTHARLWARNVRLPALHWWEWLALSVVLLVLGFAWSDLWALLG
jgi:hypothetical protein